MAPRRAIGERMKRAGSLAVRREIAHDWAANWQRDHIETLAKIERLVGLGRASDAGQYIGQLKALSEKGFRGLETVIEALSDEDAV